MCVRIILALLQHEENMCKRNQTSEECSLHDSINFPFGEIAIFVLDYYHRQIHESMLASSISFDAADKHLANIAQCLRSCQEILRANMPSKETAVLSHTYFAKSECEHFLKRILELAIVFSNETWNGKYIDFSVWLFEQLQCIQTHLVTHKYIAETIVCDPSLNLMKIASLMRATTSDKTGLIGKEKLVSLTKSATLY